jgi:hypothetical protein
MITVLIAAAASVTNPLAPAQKGQLQCYFPDLAAKTCQGLAAYKQTGPSTFSSHSVLLIDAAGPTTLETTTTVHARDNAECSIVRSSEALASKVMVDGRQLSAPEAKPILARIASNVAPLNGREFCVRYEPAEDGTLMGQVTIGGVRRPDLDQQILWVNSSDGYAIAR